MILRREVDEFLQNFAKWASSQADIQGVALVGSYARQTPKETSDVDLVVIADHQKDFLKDLKWINHFGDVRQKQIELYGKVTSVRVWYTNGLELEYGVTDTSWATQPLDEGTLHVISYGMRVIFERGNILCRLKLG